jgi:hypothetical protein
MEETAHSQFYNTQHFWQRDNSPARQHNDFIKFLFQSLHMVVDLQTRV